MHTLMKFWHCFRREGLTTLSFEFSEMLLRMNATIDATSFAGGLNHAVPCCVWGWRHSLQTRGVCGRQGHMHILWGWKRLPGGNCHCCHVRTGFLIGCLSGFPMSQACQCFWYSKSHGRFLAQYIWTNQDLRWVKLFKVGTVFPCFSNSGNST